MFRTHTVLLMAIAACALLAAARAQESVFSGPQVGEKLPAFKVKGVVGEFAGKEYDPIRQAAGKPTLLIFFHEKTRPAFGMCRAIANYAGGLKESHGLTTHMVLLTDDPSTEEKWAQNVMQRYFPDKLEVAVSQDGQEGPGAYGLNRNVTLTILVGSEGKTTANFALVQPQLQADGPKLLTAIAEATGVDPVPDISELESRYAARATAERSRMRNQSARMQAEQRRGDGGKDQQDLRLTSLLRALINKQATAEEVAQAAGKVEEYIATSENARRELKRIANTVVKSGRLANYGTPAAQEVLRKWVKRFADADAQAPATKDEHPAKGSDKTDQG